MTAKYSYFDEIPHASTHYYPFKNVAYTPYVDHFRAHGRVLKSKILCQNEIQLEKEIGLRATSSYSTEKYTDPDYDFHQRVGLAKNASLRALEGYLRKRKTEDYYWRKDDDVISFTNLNNWK